MPYGARRVTVTRDHIEDLRGHGPGACLTWHEGTHQVEAVGPHTVADASRMIIIGYRELGMMAEQHAEEGREATDEDLARDLTDIATAWRAEWPEIRAMHLQVTVLRRSLADAGVHLATSPTFRLPTGGLPQMTDYYHLAGSSRRASVTVSFGFIEPTRITGSDSDDDTQPIADLRLGIDGTLTHLAISRLIASTVTYALCQDC